MRHEQGDADVYGGGLYLAAVAIELRRRSVVPYKAMVRRGLGFALLGIFAGFVGCSSKCTEAGCSDETVIVVSLRAAAPLPSGNYVFEIVTDKESLTVTCDWTAHACTEDSQTIQGPGGFSDAKFMFMGEPTTITIRATRDGNPIGSATFTAQYSTFTVNGPDCPPICRQVSVTPDPPTLMLQ